MEIEGKTIQIDLSEGQGHCWRGITEHNCPPAIQEEIASEIVDGKVDHTADFVARNGQHYRWS